MPTKEETAIKTSMYPLSLLVQSALLQSLE